jgi:hypothetical protein
MLVAAFGPSSGPAHQRQLGLWELYLHAARDPGLRQVARAWTDGCDEIVAEVLAATGHPATAPQIRHIAALLTGLSVEYLVEARPDAAATAVAVLAHALRPRPRPDKTRPLG